MTTDSEYRLAIKALSPEMRIVVLHLEKRLEEIASMKVSIAESEREAVLSRIKPLEEKLDDIDRREEANHSSVQAWLSHQDDVTNMIRARIEEKIKQDQDLVDGAKGLAAEMKRQRESSTKVNEREH